MLKRYQVLLNDWLADALRVLSDEYDVSFSEVLRIAVCLTYIRCLSKVYPDYKVKIDEDELNCIIKKAMKDGYVEEVELHKFFTDVYFEARKLLEYWQEKREKEPQPKLKKKK